MHARTHRCQREERGAIEEDAEEQSGDFFLKKLSQGLQTDRRATDGETDTHTEAVCTILLDTLFTVCYNVSSSQVSNLK